MNHRPSDTDAYFNRLGHNYIRRAIINGEFESPLDDKAKLWLELNERHPKPFLQAASIIVVALVGIGTIIAMLVN